MVFKRFELKLQVFYRETFVDELVERIDADFDVRVYVIVINALVAFGGLHAFGRCKKYACAYPGQIPKTEGVVKFRRRWTKFRYHSLNKPQAHSCYILKWRQNT